MIILQCRNKGLSPRAVFFFCAKTGCEVIIECGREESA